MKIGCSTPADEAAINIPALDKPRLVIIGGEFAGLYLVKMLGNKDLQIVMLDRNNFHAFQPLLYQVATAMLEPEAVASSFRKIFRKQPNFHFRMVEVERIDSENKCIITGSGCLTYDLLVLATGAKTNFYGLKDISRYAFPMKHISEAIAIRQRIFDNFEKALMIQDAEQRQGLMNIVIVGGGPTGIEIAGAIGELKKFILPYDYKELDLNTMHIYLVESTKRLLAGMSERASRLARKSLEKFSVTVLLNTEITAYDGKTALTSNGDRLPTRMLIWVAGVTGNIPTGLGKAEVAAGGRLKVDAFNKVMGYKNIYAIGDVAAMITNDIPNGHPMLAPVAIQQAKNLAANISFEINADPKKQRPFVYKYHGIMATVGRNRAVVETSRFSFGGLPAWLTWLFVHLVTLIGFRNKIIAIVNWGWNYLSYDRGMRLIIPFSKRPPSVATAKTTD